MDTWLQTCLLLCLYGFFKEMRPSEPFLTEYLMGPQQNLTSDQVTYDVYPVWTYSYLALLIVVFLLTDLLRYKPVIVFEGIGYVITWSLLLWARGVRAMQFMEFTYGIATSTEVAYFTYIYAKVASKFYQRVTSYTRAALLAGRFMSGILAQVLTSTRLMDYHTLNYISLTSVSVAFIIACCLPAVSTSIYFHRQQYLTTNEGESSVRLTDINSKESLHAKITKVAGFVWNDFKSAYTNKYLLKWSIWWAFATCGNYQVGNYIQPLWESIAPMDQNDQLYNGAVEAIQTLLSSLAAFSVGYIHFNWELFGEGTLAIISLLDGLLLLFMGLSSSIIVGYLNYILFRISYQVLITIASYQVAKQLTADSYGLVFGINMFASLLLQSVLTFVVVETLEVESSTQFIIYGSYYMILALVFFLLSTYTCAKLGCDGIREIDVWEPQPDCSNQEPPLGTTEAVVLDYLPGESKF
ncbi:thiamine transporter 1-like isoform X2 [Homarus americanus]|nr:thiamine transporter 1-like isoform X2 [Homarus americanus]XP_042216081.1 thiamine transporter 1-like isoform X2 [Homarus americanus]XP_042216082.1 thiamine transporter 1-like isoform X2 [Homarus americanus]XP_042216083.1 thiamine transporter 1-like isoform X2 [Homarus americanus]XP_042216084.1 thiamine transporter 1-like isoform X2 [Homarus americanus]XP_042216085.1 thiamine transporter 1-like isoform X2 [Homarus americanus]XP_042216086.1 thiamine transporter 1-like isoform X2 [Homarus am